MEFHWWSDLVEPLLVVLLVVAGLVAGAKLWWLRMDGKRTALAEQRHAQRCASCAAGVYHSQHPSSEER